MALLTYDRAITGTLRAYQRKADGAWLAEADTSREGIYLYPAEDGTDRMLRELRPPSVVAIMAQKVGHAVFTMGHPDQPVTTDNVTTLLHGNFDSDYDTPDQGGFVRSRNHVVLRTTEAIDAARTGKLKGFSPGYIPIRDNTPGVDPKWGPYDRTLIDIASVNHVAGCGDSDDLPPARGGNDICALYLDSATLPKRQPMIPILNRATRRAYLATDAGKALAAKVTGLVRKKGTKDSTGAVLTTDDFDFPGYIAMLTAAKDDPVASLVAVSLANAILGDEPDMNATPTDPGAPMDGTMPPAMGAEMDRRAKAAADAIRSEFAPKLAELDALKRAEQARDTANRTASEGAFRTDAGKLGIRDATTLAIDALVATAAQRLDIDTTGLATDAALLVVSRTTARRAANPGPLAAFDAADTAINEFDLRPKGK